MIFIYSRWEIEKPNCDVFKGWKGNYGNIFKVREIEGEREQESAIAFLHSLYSQCRPIKQDTNVSQNRTNVAQSNFEDSCFESITVLSKEIYPKISMKNNAVWLIQQ